VRPDVVEQARRQQGLLTAAQLGTVDPDWCEVQPGVFAPRVVVLTAAQRTEAVRLALDLRAGAPRNGSSSLSWCFAGPTAAQLLGLRVPTSALSVLVQGTTRPKLRDVRVLSTHTLPRLRRISGRPVPDVCTAVVQCAAVLSRDDVVSLVEHAVRQRRCTLPQLLAACRRGVAGARLLRSVIEELQRDGIDRWVRRLVRLLVAAGLPRPEVERGVPAHDPLVYLDLCWWALRLAVEVDDWETHASREASERDKARDRAMMRDYGVTVLRVTPRQIRDRPASVVRDIVAAYRRAERASAS
jgi:hypothetical protein